MALDAPSLGAGEFLNPKEFEMYALVLAMAVSTPQHGLLFNRGSCNGIHAVQVVRERIAVRAHSTGCSGAVHAPVRAAIQAWNFPLLHLVAEHRPLLMRSTGCGSTVSFSKTVNRTVGTAPVVYAPMPQAPEQLGERIGRAAIHRQLRVALRSGNLTPAQAAIAKQALSDSDVYEAAVAKVYRDLRKAPLTMPAGTQAVFGDGTILKLLLDNLPAILDAIAQIIKMFG